jgi:DNA-binding MarR family transcriptional regulator
LLERYDVVIMSDRAEPAQTFALFVADIFETTGRLRRMSDAIARSVGQSQARWQVLSVVSEGRWSVPRIADRLGVTRQNVQRVADDLVESGMASFEENEHHRRSPFLMPTKAGIATLKLLTAAIRDFDAKLATAVGPTKLVQAGDTLRQIRDALRRMERDARD